jgi:phasin family protein
MFSIPEQFSNATKANFEAQFAIFSALTNKAFEGVEKFVDLNLTAAKASLEESSATTKQLLSAKDPQEFFSLATAQAQPNAEKTIAYGRHLASIASSTAETQIAETNRKVISLVEEVSKNAPAGSENAVALLKSAIGNANAGYEQFTKTAKQAVESIESNLSSAVNQFTTATAKAAAKK